MIFLILSSILYAFNNLLWKRTLSEFNLWIVIGSRSFLTSVTGISIILLFYFDAIQTIHSVTLISIMCASILGALGLICMILALKKGSLAQLGVFNLIIVFFIASYLYFFENILVQNYTIASLLIIVGFGSYIFQIQNNNRYSFRQLVLFIMMSFFFAGASLLHWYNLKQAIPAIISVTIQELVVFLSVVILVLSKPSLVPQKGYFHFKKIVIPIVLMSVIIFAAVWTGFLGLQYTNPLISALISLVTPILTILFGVLFYKDKWSYFSLLALLLIISGVYLINLEIA